MTSRYLRILAVSGGLFVAAAPSFATEAPPTLIQAQATATKASLEPGRLTQPVTDDAAVLSADELAEIEGAIQEVSKTQGKSVRVVFLRSFGQYTPPEWVDKAVAANGSNTAVLAISPDERLYNVGGGEEWTQSEIDRMNSAAHAQLSEMNWSSAALNAVNAVAGGSSSSGDGAGWLAGGLGVAALAGGGVYAATRKGSKKQQAKQIESAKALDPADTDSLGRLPTPTLEEVARDALVSADDSITQGKQELELATAEFGADRVRPFTSAMNEATTTLQRAFATHQKLYDAIPETEPEKRAMLVDIISSAGRAEQALRDKTTEFNEMRGVLMRAPEEVEKVLARTVDIRARLEPARATLAQLQGEYPAQILESIVDNVDLAEASLDEAEKALGEARTLADKPAGRQGALLDTLAAATRAVNVSDTNLAAIEHAEDNIRAAKANLPALIDEIRGELREIEQVKGARAQGAPIDVTTLDTVSAKAQRMLSEIGDRDQSDPLALYQELTSMDAEIDEALDRAKGIAGDQSRALQLFDQQMQVAGSQIQRAEDLILSRGRIIGSHARTLLAEAKRQYAQAHQLRVRDTRTGIDAARAATDTARRAEAAANDDLRRYQAQRNRQTADSLASAVLWGSVLSGGFGGGGFGGGGFGGGGGFSGGRPSNRGGTF
ncbi:TPM domain-containing protein [Corynebacterium sp. ACRQP]|uniref:TPM domain-containing protein n=1 Tax=Corynebacterium sp. ACRQP TaxID=2918195 RepID=UPI001EF47FFE|nr:TPM domain-containing protein [Corynebacterium sp. ACRQP]MCG7235494.1 TPM domain-containing protein [Corynebacterium sp. ACRQP]